MSDSGLISQLRTTLGKIEVALGVVPESILWTDVSGSVLWCNQAFDRLVQKPHIEVLGSRLENVLKVPLTLAEGTRSYILKQGEQERHLAIWVSKLGETVSGNYVIVIYDETERHEVQKQLQEQIDESQRMINVMMDREERILELKAENEKLREKLNL